MTPPKIAIVGRPNVGKSTLFNCLTKSRNALVSDYSGLTRDRQYGQIELDDIICNLIDTGGITNEENIITKAVEKQTITAINDASIIYFIVSAKEGLSNLDFEIASKVRNSKKDTILIANKSESVELANNFEFYELGLGDPIPISAEHRQGISRLKEATHKLLIKKNYQDYPPLDIASIKIAILGRPNVGKSTLINKIIGTDRLLAIDLPGTTRDSIAINFKKDDKNYILIDTAGIRRKKNIKEKIEKFSIVKALDAIENSNLTILLLDATEGVTEQDATLLGIIIDRGKPLLIAINKWDAVDDYQKKELKRTLELKLNFVDYVKQHYISALKNKGINKLFPDINIIYKNSTKIFSTSLLNKILEQAIVKSPLNFHKGKRIKLKFMHQIASSPMTFAIYGSRLNMAPNSYKRYLTNFLRKELNLIGIPIKLEFKISNNPFKNRKIKLSKRQITKKRRLMKFVKSS